MSNSEETARSSDQTVAVDNPDGRSNIVFVCEHASNTIPAELDGLGLDDTARNSHIAWDPGALAVAQRLSHGLDAALVWQRISRLVYDCNRPPEAASAIPERSEIYRIPGNAGLDPAGRADRVVRFYRPFQHALANVLEHRIATGRSPILVTIHSFAPVFESRPRTVELGIVHDTDRRFADGLLTAAMADDKFVVARNDPYGPADGVTHTLVDQALQRGLLNVMIEIRNDLIADDAGQGRMAKRLAKYLITALADIADASHETGATTGTAHA